ncbi:MAG: serine/threonine-protein phosphatase [Chloroflexi bacterium]|nr:serine/threonine-protein phosphatase [Chloroflexota bacterium]
MPLLLSIWADKHVGRVKPNNEDEVLFKTLQRYNAPPVALLIVADGVGGSLGGELASATAVGGIEQHLQVIFESKEPGRTRRLDTAETDPVRLISNAVQEANRLILNLAQKRPEEAGDTSSTLTMGVILDDRLTTANVGDSRTYLLRSGKLQPLTTDHSLVASLVAVGQIRPEDIYTHPQRNIILRSLGSRSKLEVDITGPHELQSADRLLLCSDGLWEMVRDPEIRTILTRAPDPRSACETLVQRANEMGGEDNIGVVVAFVI